MTFVPKFPNKVQYLFNTSIEKFVGGRKDYDKEFLFLLLLIRKVSNWSFRTVAEMGKTSLILNHIVILPLASLRFKKPFLVLVKG